MALELLGGGQKNQRGHKLRCDGNRFLQPRARRGRVADVERCEPRKGEPERALGIQRAELELRAVLDARLFSSRDRTDYVVRTILVIAATL